MYISLLENAIFQIAVNSVLRNEAEVKYKYEAAVSFCKSRISEMRAEERRRVSYSEVVFIYHACVFK